MKSRMSGLVKDYTRAFKAIMNWDTGDSDPRYYAQGTHNILGNEDGHYIYNSGYALSDAPWHGWENESLKNEQIIYDKIETAYLYLLKSLAEAIGYEFPENQDVWKYHLQYINTDEILKLKHNSRI